MVAPADSPGAPVRVPGSIPPEDPYVAGARSVAERRLAKALARGPGDPVDLFAVSFGLVQTTSVIGRGTSFSSALVRAEDWTTIGHVVSRQSSRGMALRTGAMTARFTDGRVFEAFAPADDPGFVGLYLGQRLLGCWRATDMTYEGRFAQPLRRELWAVDRRIGVVDSSLLAAGCAVLELDPDGLALVPIRVRAPGMIGGNPWHEVLKATPFGRNLGPRAANLDTVLAPQATWIEEHLDLFFVATLALRTLVVVKQPSSD